MKRGVGKTHGKRKDDPSCVCHGSPQQKSLTESRSAIIIKWIMGIPMLPAKCAGRMGEQMNRRELREQIFMLLFRVEFNQKDDMPEQCTLFLEDGDTEISEKDAAYIRSKYEKIAEKLPEIDKLINETAIGWDTQRMGKVELTIIRLAVYEIRFDETVPTGVAINEAVELAKTYCDVEAKSFINALLAKLAD